VHATDNAIKINCYSKHYCWVYPWRWTYFGDSLYYAMGWH